MWEESLQLLESTQSPTRMSLNNVEQGRGLAGGLSDALCNHMAPKDSIIGSNDLILVTGAAGFIGTRVVQNLLERGYTNLRCFVRNSSNLTRLRQIIDAHAQWARAEIVTGNLLSREDCIDATRGVDVIYHLAAGTGTKSFSDAFMN